MREGGRRRRRRGVWLLLVVVLIALAGGGYMWWRASADQLPDPATVALPEVEQLDETAVYLAGPGAPIQQLHRVTGELLDAEPSSATCQALVAELEPLGGPRNMLDLALGVPDPTTSDIAVESVSASIDALAACLDGGDLDEERLQYAHDLLQRRLSEVGAQ